MHEYSNPAQQEHLKQRLKHLRPWWRRNAAAPLRVLSYRRRRKRSKMLMGLAFCKEMATQKMKMGASSIGNEMARKFSTLKEEKRVMKDHNRRLMAEKFEVKRKLYKALCRDPDLPQDVREKSRYKLSKLPRNSSFARIRNRCILTGRPRAVYQLFRMSRICFRELASRGALHGIKKASW